MSVRSHSRVMAFQTTERGCELCAKSAWIGRTNKQSASDSECSSQRVADQSAHKATLRAWFSSENEEAFRIRTAHGLSAEQNHVSASVTGSA